MKYLYAAAAIVLLAESLMILRICRDTSCQRCYRGWAIYSRRTMHVCRMCRNDIDRKGLLAPTWPRE